MYFDDHDAVHKEDLYSLVITTDVSSFFSGMLSTPIEDTVMVL